MVFCGILANFRTVVSTFGLLGLWRCHFGWFVVTNQCSLCSNLHFSSFVPHFLCFSEAVRTLSLFVQSWTGHGRHYPNVVCGIVQQACGPTFPSLFFYPFLPPFFPLFLLFSTLFTLFPLPVSFFTFFQFSRNVPSPPLFFCVFPRFLVKATRLHVTPLPAMCPTRHLPHTGSGML